MQTDLSIILIVDSRIISLHSRALSKKFFLSMDTHSAGSQLEQKISVWSHKKSKPYIQSLYIRIVQDISLSNMVISSLHLSKLWSHNRKKLKHSEQRSKHSRIQNNYPFGYTLQNSLLNSSNFPASIACRDFFAISRRYSRLWRERRTHPVASPTFTRWRRYPREYLRDTCVSNPGSIGIFSWLNLCLSPPILIFP